MTPPAELPAAASLRQRAQRLAAKCRAARAQVKQLRAQLERLGAECDAAHAAVMDKVARDAYVTGMTTTHGLNIGLEGGACRLLAETFGQQLRDSGAENYVELAFVSRDAMPGESLVVTLQRQVGKTPHQLRKVAESELEAARAELARLQGVLADRGDDGPMHGPERTRRCCEAQVADLLAKLDAEDAAKR